MYCADIVQDIFFLIIITVCRASESCQLNESKAKLLAETETAEPPACARDFKKQTKTNLENKKMMVQDEKTNKQRSLDKYHELSFLRSYVLKLTPLPRHLSAASHFTWLGIPLRLAPPRIGAIGYIDTDARTSAVGGRVMFAHLQVYFGIDLDLFQDIPDSRDLFSSEGHQQIHLFQGNTMHCE
jgi:hypothetical protein